MAGLLAVRVQPGAATDAIVGWQGQALRVRVSAPAREGRANAAVARLLAAALGVPPSTVELARGAAGRDKLFRLRTLDTADARARLGGPGAPPAPGRAPR
ncbi:MAG TPA: DUF167 domain-containing protein [Methylomirabilota bacterium]|nr:DUF167 domain-containing protein [Methylomirabilota bacterium]